MTPEIGFLLLLLAVLVVLFLTEKIPVDLTAFTGLVILILGGYLRPEEAFTGFSSPAVITMLSIFILGAALLHTGLADVLGRRIHSLVGSREILLIATLMLVTGLLSSFMNNIAAAAVMMPAAGSLARRSGLSPSRLFMPLSFGAILGGTLTLVGTPPNILAAELLEDRGLVPFGLFDFTPLGVIILLAGITYMSLIGRRILPERLPASAASESRRLARVYDLNERLFSIRIPPESEMDGLTLAEARLRTALNLQVIAILRKGRRKLAPEPQTVLQGGDMLLAEGSLADLRELFRVRGVEIQEVDAAELPRPARGVSAIRMRLREGAAFVGRTLKDLRFREKFGAVVVGIRRDDRLHKERLASLALRANDELFALGARPQLVELGARPEFDVEELGLSAVEQLQEQLYLMRIPEGSSLVGETLGSSRIGELVGITVGGLIRDEETRLAVSAEETIRAGDRLLVAGEPSRIVRLLEIGKADIDGEISEPILESEDVGVVEAAIAPRSSVAGRTIGELRFRDRYGLQVLAVWREGKPLHAGLAELTLNFGDALLVQGEWDRIRQLAADPDFLVLSQTVQTPRRTAKAPVALAALGGLIAMVVTGFQPVEVAAFTAAVVTILAGAVRMEEVYRAIEWRSLFLVAALIPFGTALEHSGAHLLLGQLITDFAGPYGAYALLAGFIVVSNLLSQGLDSAPAVVLLAPVVIQASIQFGISPYPLMMGIALAASAGFMWPFSQKSNLLVMGAGGYRTPDFLKVGGPLTLLLLVLLVFLVPVFFPF